MSNPHVGDVGVVFLVTVRDRINGTVVDISDASVLEVTLKPESGDAVAYDAEFTTDGTDGQFQYSTVDDNFDRAGLWHWQEHFVTSNLEFHGEIKHFTVDPNLDG